MYIEGKRAYIELLLRESIDSRYNTATLEPLLLLRIIVSACLRRNQLNKMLHKARKEVMHVKTEVIREVLNSEELTPLIDNAKLITITFLGGVRIEGGFNQDLVTGLQGWNLKLDELGIKGAKKVAGMDVEVVFRKYL